MRAYGVWMKASDKKPVSVRSQWLLGNNVAPPQEGNSKNQEEDMTVDETSQATKAQVGKGDHVRGRD